jgi:hypothetical protein
MNVVFVRHVVTARRTVVAVATVLAGDDMDTEGSPVPAA